MEALFFHNIQLRQSLVSFIKELTTTLLSSRWTGNRTCWALDPDSFRWAARDTEAAAKGMQLYMKCPPRAFVPNICGLSFGETTSLSLCDMDEKCPLCAQTEMSNQAAVVALFGALRGWVNDIQSAPAMATVSPGDGLLFQVEERNDVLLLFTGLTACIVSNNPDHPLQFENSSTHSHLQTNGWKPTPLPPGYQGTGADWDRLSGVTVSLRVMSACRLVLYRPSDAQGAGCVYALFAKNDHYTMDPVLADDAIDVCIGEPPEGLELGATLTNDPNDPLRIRRRFKPGGVTYYEFIENNINGTAVCPTTVHIDPVDHVLLVKACDHVYRVRVVALPGGKNLPIFEYDVSDDTQSEADEATMRPSQMKERIQGWSSDINETELQACYSPTLTLITTTDWDLNDNAIVLYDDIMPNPFFL